MVDGNGQPESTLTTNNDSEPLTSDGTYNEIDNKAVSTLCILPEPSCRTRKKKGKKARANIGPKSAEDPEIEQRVPRIAGEVQVSGTNAILINGNNYLIIRGGVGGLGAGPPAGAVVRGLASTAKILIAKDDSMKQARHQQEQQQRAGKTGFFLPRALKSGRTLVLRSNGPEQENGRPPKVRDQRPDASAHRSSSGIRISSRYRSLSEKKSFSERRNSDRKREPSGRKSPGGNRTPIERRHVSGGRDAREKKSLSEKRSAAAAKSAGGSRHSSGSRSSSAQGSAMERRGKMAVASGQEARAKGKRRKRGAKHKKKARAKQGRWTDSGTKEAAREKPIRKSTSRRRSRSKKTSARPSRPLANRCSIDEQESEEQTEIIVNENEEPIVTKSRQQTAESARPLIVTGNAKENVVCKRGFVLPASEKSDQRQDHVIIRGIDQSMINKGRPIIIRSGGQQNVICGRPSGGGTYKLKLNVSGLVQVKPTIVIISTGKGKNFFRRSGAVGNQDPRHQNILRHTARNGDEDVAANRRCLLAAGGRGKTARDAGVKEDPGCGCRMSLRIDRWTVGERSRKASRKQADSRSRSAEGPQRPAWKDAIVQLFLTAVLAGGVLCQSQPQALVSCTMISVFIPRGCLPFSRTCPAGKSCISPFSSEFQDFR
ncbi:hypothetical protein C7M84_002907 [Penaeus vannamei]|uniref:Uncharacterized protein n=1 Tax=Penaeus vannamei TaxID=6689 RepID=A0A423TPJ2_PENVA|nr:hypothetical protein C7M84_002907 [Penaeus vannamei]